MPLKGYTFMDLMYYRAWAWYDAASIHVVGDSDFVNIFQLGSSSSGACTLGLTTAAILHDVLTWDIN